MSDSTRNIELPLIQDMPPEYTDGKLDDDLRDPRNPEAELRADIAWHELTEGLGDRGGVLASSRLNPKQPFTSKQVARYAVAALAGNLDSIEARKSATLQRLDTDGRAKKHDRDLRGTMRYQIIDKALSLIPVTPTKRPQDLGPIDKHIQTKR
jgi:hypothetical protein